MVLCLRVLCKPFYSERESLNTFDGLEDLNRFLESENFRLNDSGGKIKGSKKVFLEQSSTKASSKKIQFSDGEFEIPSCYYEFAKRYSMKDGQLYQGFVTTSADKIFESTNIKNAFLLINTYNLILRTFIDVFSYFNLM